MKKDFKALARMVKESGAQRYQCVCLPGWEGTFCENESNECNSEPCKNNGTCMDLFNSYRATTTFGKRRCCFITTPLRNAFRLYIQYHLE
ncbi:hypothetical protein AV530_005775 [Patagioenas fasciata monilis]|uniref:EGF-like domain-containing protein n=1 Tax=Patagioenas fasciata monilis TaxID=372326 RepID=A0A1V4JMK2_PATFA|nr:hypothetical protein AV530_005775 [Patagioenas fasciata monilis]